MNTSTLELGMMTRQQQIPYKDRCVKCDGTGSRRIGCAITHAIYSRCWACDGTGLKSVADELQQAFRCTGTNHE